MDESAEDEVIRQPLATAIDRASYLPAPLHVIANVLTWGASRIFRRRFGVGANEWRVLGALSVRAGITAGQACALLGMNKSVASMSIRKLQERGLVAIEAAAGSRRIYLTRAGADMHDAMVPIARAREAILLSGLAPGEAAELRRLVDGLEARLEELQAYDDGLAGPDAEEAEAVSRPALSTKPS